MGFAQGLLRGAQIAQTFQAQQDRERRLALSEQYAQQSKEQFEWQKTQAQQAKAESEQSAARQARLDELERIMDLDAKGAIKLDPETRKRYQSGQDFSIPLGEGATTASSAIPVQVGDQVFLLPRAADRQMAADRAQLGQKEAEYGVGRQAVPAQVAQQLGINPNTQVNPTELSSLLGRLPQADKPEAPYVSVDDSGVATAVDRRTGETLWKKKIGKGKTGQRPRLQAVYDDDGNLTIVNLDEGKPEGTIPGVGRTRSDNLFLGGGLLDLGLGGGAPAPGMGGVTRDEILKFLPGAR